MDHKELEKYLLSKDGARLEYPFGENVAVYKVASKIFALVREGSDPLSINLKCDPNLAQHLRQKYESIMPSYHMNKKHWNTVLLTGQLTDREVLDLVDHSYSLVAQEPALQDDEGTSVSFDSNIST